jgi:hypothetical protein
MNEQDDRRAEKKGDHAPATRIATEARSSMRGATKLPREAVDGLMRVWLEILRETYGPAYAWVVVPAEEEPRP